MMRFLIPLTGYAHDHRLNALQLFLQLRVLTLGIIIMIGVLAYWGLGVVWPMPVFISVIMGFMAMSIWAQWRIHRVWQGFQNKQNEQHGRGLHERLAIYEPLAHAVVDVILFSAFLYITGGVSNPFAVLYLPLLGVAAILLPMLQLLTLGVLCIAAYSLLMQHYIPLILPDPGNAFALHVFGMWANFAFSAVLLAGFVLRLNTQRKQQQMEVMRIKALQLQEQKNVHILQAQAQWAHRLATPLSSILMVVDDLEDAAQANASQQQLVKALQPPIEQLKQSLQEFKQLNPSAVKHLDKQSQTNSTLGLIDAIEHSRMALDAWKNLNPWSTLIFDINPKAIKFMQDNPNALYGYCSSTDLTEWLHSMTNQAASMIIHHHKQNNVDSHEQQHNLKVSVSVCIDKTHTQNTSQSSHFELAIQYAFYALVNSNWQPLVMGVLACECQEKERI